MKRFLPAIPVFLLLFLYACGNATPSVVPAEMGTAVAQTQTAVMWTPMPTSTPDPDEAKIVEWLNASLSGMDSLERTVDAHYQINDVVFTMEVFLPVIFQVNMRCECAMNSRCCVPERMFVVAMHAMKAQSEKVIGQVPGNTVELHLNCYDRQTLIGVMVVNWSDVEGYFKEKINGYQLGARVRKVNLP
jgi:hypothetical protein